MKIIDVSRMSKELLSQKTGSLYQLAGIRPVVYTTGKADGVKAYEINTGGGLDFTVLESKCLDISVLRYKGINLSFISKPDMTAPEYYNHTSGLEFLRHFGGGFLYTCGLSNVGTSCIEEGIEYGMHGRIGQTPAEQTGWFSGYRDGCYVLEVSGMMRETGLYRENLTLRRTISTSLGQRKFFIKDEVENLDFKPATLMLLYHFNLGFPLLDNSSRLIAPILSTTPRDEYAMQGIDNVKHFQNPDADYTEQVFYHTLASNNNGTTALALVNPELEAGVYIKYDTGMLDNLTQWKSMKSGDYALGLEPGNCHVEGRVEERKRGTLKQIMPFEKKTIEIECGILDGMEEINAFETLIDIK